MGGSPLPAPHLYQISKSRAGAFGLGALVLSGILYAFGPVPALLFEVVEAGVGVVVVSAALFGSEAVSERAFRLLRWLADRPEPPTPPRKLVPGAPSSTPTLKP